MADMTISGVTFSGGYSIQFPPPPPPYFIAQGPTSGVSEGRSIAIDSSGNMYVVGSLNGDIDISIAKYSVSTGGIVWQYKIDTTYNDAAYSIYIDGSDNVFVAGRVLGSGFGGFYPEAVSWVAKFNTSGSIVWQTKITAGTYGSVISQIVTDTSGNIIVGGYTGGEGGWVSKLNSSGTVQWVKTTGMGSGVSGVTTDSSDNIYINGSSSGYPPSGGVIIKLNTSGTQQWAKTWAVGGNLYTNVAGGITASSTGYIYTTFSGGDTNGEDAYLVKLSATDGSQVWQRKLEGGGRDTATAVAVDSSENIYWLINAWFNYQPGISAYTERKGVMSKYNSSGAIQWQRHMYVSGQTYPNALQLLNSIIKDNSGNFYVTGKMSDTNILAKLPDDGTLTGTYTVNGIPIIYNTSSLTESSGSISLGTGGAFIGAGTASQTATAFTPISTSYTITTVVIS